jgi:hypothetical protein
MASKPLSHLVEIPDVSLNERLVPANDNHEPSALSRAFLEAESILALRDGIKPSKIPLLVIAALGFMVAAFALWGVELLSSAQ